MKMAKKGRSYRRAFGRQVAVELPIEHLNRASGGQDDIVIQSTRTCDGTQTYTPTGRDCSGGTDTDAYPV
jgi:hypothetical protein